MKSIRREMNYKMNLNNLTSRLSSRGRLNTQRSNIKFSLQTPLYFRVCHRNLEFTTNIHKELGDEIN
jgi:hypothetical protein